jgi:TolB-like protein
MPSIIEGYDYDIFISYRQKDNKYDGWVTEFVDNLKKELEATFKEEINVYFDINPHDGLLETHDVDASLKDKLKCLIFIPIISRTYCDPKSFAWEHEFKAFVEQASQDQFGLKVKLPSGNVASRVLPVRIYDLDYADIKECESILGGVLRGIEFIYKSAGVNRPLRSKEENPQENLNHTIYRDQINKVANAVKEIISGLRKYGQQEGKVPMKVVKAEAEKPENLKVKIITGTLLVLALILLGYFLIPKLFKSSESVEKSIAVLPFINDSPDDTNTYFINGLMEDILNNLQKIKDMRVISRTSVEQYRKQSKPIPEIAKELNVNYIVEGSGQKFGNTIRLSVQLLKADKEGHLWGNSYEQEIHNAKEIFIIQSQIAQSIATELKAVITPLEKQLIEKTCTENLEAYDAYLKGEFYRKKYTINDLKTAMKYYQIALEKDPEYALAYCGIASVWFGFSGIGYLYPYEGLPKGYAALISAAKLDSTLVEVHYGIAWYKFSAEFDWGSSESEFQKTFRINPNFAEAHAQYSLFLNVIGRHEEAMEQIGLALKLDPYDPFIKSIDGFDLLYTHRYGEAIAACREALKIEPTIVPGLSALTLAFHLAGRYDEALETWKTVSNISYPGFAHTFDQGYAKAGYIGALSCEADALVEQSKTRYINPMDIAWLDVCSGNKRRALDYLERAFEVRDQNLISLTMPLFDSLHNEPRYQALFRKMHLPYK